MTKPELSFVRNKSFSYWHRSLSDHYYLQDIDHMTWQIYNKQAQTLALLEEKASNIKSINLNDFQFQALRNLARDIPVFVLVSHFNENQNYFSFYIVSANEAARQFMKEAGQKDRRYLSEGDYITLEARLRKEKPDLSRITNASILLDKFPLPRIINEANTRTDREETPF